MVSDANEVISETVSGVELQFRAGSFFQNNPFILPKLVEYVLSEALGTTTPSASASAPKSNDVSAESIEYLVDTYCGSGLFALAGARLFQRCAGVETAVAAAGGNIAHGALADARPVAGETAQKPEGSEPEPEPPVATAADATTTLDTPAAADTAAATAAATAATGTTAAAAAAVAATGVAESASSVRRQFVKSVKPSSGEQ